MFKLIWQKKFLIIVLVLLVALLPIAMTRESVVLSKTLLTAIGIDKQGDEYTVYGEHFIFNFDPFGVMEREMVDGSGATVEDALADIGRKLGKRVSLTHCTVMILGKGLTEESLVPILKPFLLKPQLSNTCTLFYTESDVGSLLETSIEIGDARSGRLQVIAEFNRKQNDFKSTHIERFLRDSMGRRGIAKIAIIAEEDGEIINEGEYAVFLHGQLTTPAQ